MKTVLCFGDSNTWGFNPVTTERYSPSHRWPEVLKASLQELHPGQFDVIAEGQNGRTTVWEDPLGPKRGSDYLLPCLESHKPVDLVIIMLGTNDLKHRFGLSAYDVAKGLGRLVELVRGCEFGPGSKAPKVLVIAPPHFGAMGPYAKDFQGQADQSFHLGAEIGEFAALKGFPFFDAGKVVSSSDVDGIHLEPGEQVKLGKALAPLVIDLLAV